VFESSDFATLSDSFIASRISILDLPNHDYDTTGAGIAWDYSAFTPVSQRQVRFSDPDFTGFRTAYLFSCSALCYNGCYNDCVNSGGLPFICAGACNFDCSSTCLSNWFTKFDLAEKTNDSINLIITTIEDIFNFYDISQDALSQVAVGAKLSGFPIVLEYENPDRVYAFPLEFGNRDTSFSNFSLRLDSIPGTGIPVSLVYNHSQQRFNHIEGWGTLTTPFGVFNDVLKLKSVTHGQDTVIFNSDTLPLSLIQQDIVEYKWFSPDFGIPLLKVTARVINGNLIYQDLEYLDSLRCFDPASVFGYQPFPAVINQGDDSVEVGFFSLSTNGDSFAWDFDDPSSASNQAAGSDAVHVFNEGGVFNVQLVTCNTSCSTPLCDTFSLPVLIIDLSTDTTTALAEIQIGFSIEALPNPFQRGLLININSAVGEMLEFQLLDLAGKPEIVIPAKYYSAGSHSLEIDLNGLPPGIYFMEASSDVRRCILKIIKTSGGIRD